MNLVRLAVRQPVTVLVGIVLVLLAGIVALRRIPIQLTPNVEDTIVAVTTLWEGASPVEIEREIVDRQEEKLQGIANLRSITSTSQTGRGVVRLEFVVGTSKEAALREVSDKLRQVPRYPDNVDEPVIEASDPENRDFIAWVILGTDDPGFDVRTLQDFAEDRIKPVLERIPGMSEVNVLGGREREVQVRYDPLLLASKGISPSAFVQALQSDNRDVSAGALEVSKADVRVRLAGQFERLVDVEETIVAQTPGGPVFVRDVADAVETFKEPRTFVRSRGESVLAINAQKEVGANVMSVMRALQEGIGALNAPGGLLEVQARKLGLDGGLSLNQVYDQTIYIEDALALVQDNIWIGGALAVLVLLLFLRTLRTVGIVALAIPISVVGAIVAMVAMGRSINVISLAGMAFAVGMVVDNAIVVLENVYRHIEMGKPPMRAAVDGGKEVFGAVLASTLTTAAVFIPILLVEEEAGQLFRDISLAIVAAVVLSLLVSLTVIPTSAARILRPRTRASGVRRGLFARIPDGIAGLVHWLNGSVLARISIVAGLAGASVAGTLWLAPPTDYLPQGNRNLVFGLLIPPPGYNQEQQTRLAERIEETVRPFWEASRARAGEARPELPAIPALDVLTGQTREVVPPPLVNYFLVSFDGILFHGGICDDPRRVVDMLPLFQHATRPRVAPGVLAFAFQVPLFRLGGSTGSAIKINFAGDDLDQVAHSALAVFMELTQRYSPFSVQPAPANFNVGTPELRIEPDRRRLAEAGLAFEDVALAVQALGDGAIVGEFRKEGDAIDLKVISKYAVQTGALDRVPDSPIATPMGKSVPLSSVTRLARVNAAEQINRVGRQRAITLQFTPPRGLALEQAVEEIAAVLAAKRGSGQIPPDVDTSFTGSASKLAAVQRALLGDGTLAGTLGSSLLLALLVVYLLLCVLFQSFVHPVVIMFSVPLATLGGFAALRGVYLWSVLDPYMPVQQLDVLTMLGFVILIGVVVNNAILIVHQALNFMRPAEDDESPGGLAPRAAITEAVRTRVRPIFMSTLTSVGGMAPLVFMPGSGSELYRGLGSVVVGGLLVSTIFTLVLVPLLMSLVMDAQARLRTLAGREAAPGATLGGAAALLLALVGMATLGSCAGRRQPAPRFEDLATRIATDVVRAIPPTEPHATRFPESKVETVLANRMAELEELGGYGSWLSFAPDYGTDLFDQAAPPEDITLEAALAAALENNLGLRFARLGPQAQREAVVAEQAAFDFVLFSDLAYEQVDEPRPVPFIDDPVLGPVRLGTAVSAHDRGRVQAGVRKLLHTGGTVSAVTFLERFENQSTGIDFDPNPAYRAGVAVEITQPLLRGFGEDFNTAQLELARRQTRRSEEDVRAEALTLVALVEQAYWDLREAHARLLIQQRLTAEGEEVERVLAERREFDAQPAQYADALATVEQRRANLIRARFLVRQASDSLKALLDWGGASLATESLLMPMSEFDWAPVPIDFRSSVVLAVGKRPELRAALLDIEDAELRTRLADNLHQPQLDVLGRVRSVTEQGDFASSADAVAENDFLSGFFGLVFELPVGNRAASADARRARIEGRASLLRYEELLRDVVLEVKDVLRDLRTSFELLGATRAFRIAQTENLRALLLEQERRSSLTPEFLRLMFDRQERLARAQLEEVQSLANFNRALAAYRRAVGTGPVLEALSEVAEEPPPR